MGDVVLLKLKNPERGNVLRFVDSHRHDKQATELTKMQFVSQAMELVAAFNITTNEKKVLVMYMYSSLAENNDCGFSNQFDIDGAIEFVWDTYKGKYTITLKKQGFLSNALCCGSASVTVDTSKQTIDAKSTDV